jgi:D-alanyl-D-alanine dipeptidase
LVSAAFTEAGQTHAIAHDGNAKANHGAIEGEDRHVYSCFMKLDLVAIAPPDFDVDVTLAYATDANLTGRPVYRNAECWLHREAADKLAAAAALARPLGLRLRIFDALRPVEAQWALWTSIPTGFLADPRVARRIARRGGRSQPAGRGGRELDRHGVRRLHAAVAPRQNRFPPMPSNRLLLMGLMTAAGWDFYRNEWRHYQLFDARLPASRTPICPAR